MGRLSPILQDRHDRALSRFKKSNKALREQRKAEDNARPGKTFMQETHEKFNPGGKAIINSMKGEADG